MKIVELDAVTIGQIAAGEIIERPASVVKELVENAVDAGASRISVILERGGIDSIEVIDDGAGVDRSELPLTVRRHATSKLAAASDLESIATLGFRGEGLASIAAVSQLEIVSRTRGDDVGSRVRAHAERTEPVEPAPSPPGTRVRVENLFENVPVRREYLRSAQAEFNRISSWLSSFALAYPQVTFALRHDGNDVWTMPQTSDERERLAMVFGRDPAQWLLPLDESAASTLGGRLRGYVSAPGHDRPDRRMQLLFVNGRLLRSTLMSGAWTAGYATFAMLGRQPYGVLFLELPPEHVDPNVHPTKSDVRLRFPAQVFEAARRAISGTLHRDASARFREHTASATGVSALPDAVDTSLAHVQSLFERPAGFAEDVPGHRLRVLAQLHRTYIVATDGDALLLVDQHAAHERIAYESIVERARKPAPNEPMLVPYAVELDATQSAALDRVLETLNEGGLEIESFGERSYRILATPAGFRARTFDLGGFLSDLTEDPKQRDVRERVWASLACHSVTIAGERLEPEEMATLVERLQQCVNPMHCPHGRPTMVRLDPGDVARLFKRT
ncbi:MAG TPA: DNA mismatch repair endonuclease MutL [Candidatus Baltobacteraceae bacterium]|nr:DNA mismatch repair endonuclease MutL [Candidatus Baltobacteraceae bacterium]